MQKLRKITIGGKSYPVKIDLNVLQIIQDEYGSVNAFERDILGLKLVKGENGEQLYTKEGDPQMEITEPSVKAIKLALPAMINEGLALDAYRLKKDYKPVAENEIIASCDVPFTILANMIHEEYKKCFEVKKI